MIIQCRAAVSTFLDFPAAPLDPPWTLPSFPVGGKGLPQRLARPVPESRSCPGW